VNNTEPIFPARSEPGSEDFLASFASRGFSIRILQFGKKKLSLIMSLVKPQFDELGTYV
jgi:hypothetical protein